jgi:hypothetical protein
MYCTSLQFNNFYNTTSVNILSYINLLCISIQFIIGIHIEYWIYGYILLQMELNYVHILWFFGIFFHHSISNHQNILCMVTMDWIWYKWHDIISYIYISITNTIRNIISTWKSIIWCTYIYICCMIKCG